MYYVYIEHQDSDFDLYIYLKFLMNYLPYNSLDNREFRFELKFCDAILFDSFKNLYFDQSSVYIRYN